MSSPIAFLAQITPQDFAWLERLYWVAGIVVAGAALVALSQVRAAIRQAQCALEQNRIALDQLKLTSEQLEVSRQDIVLRSRREAISAALDQCKRFAESIVPHVDVITQQMAAKGYKQPTNVDADFPFIPQEVDPIGAKVWASEVELRVKIVHALNELESFAMYFASDLADENVAFTPTAFSFCQMCEFYRLFIGAYRHPNSMKLYQNIVKLYGMWKPRLVRTVLEEQGKTLEQKIQQLPADKRGKPLGTVL